MRILFVKQSQNYPRSSGHDVHGYFMMRALQDCGASISLLTSVPVKPEAIDGLRLEWCGCFDGLPAPKDVPKLTGMREKYRSYWGVDESIAAKVQALVDGDGYDAVAVAAAPGLPYLCHVKNAVRVWYAADDQMLHSWSLLKWGDRTTWGRIREGLLMGLYEWTYRDAVDRVWMVSKKDAGFARGLLGSGKVDIVPNGVDSDFYAPRAVPKRAKSCVFWGRLDFAPNLDAIRWFGEKVWGPLKSKHPSAVWTVYGFAAGQMVRDFQKRFEFELVCDLPDLRDGVSSHEVVVLPFVSGAGIKNKLLEAAGLGMPIMASVMALNGLDRSRELPILSARRPEEWIEGLERLWEQPLERERVGRLTREWVMVHHSWLSSARIAMAGIAASQPVVRKRSPKM
jgi:polysaccharide biosynthesis protein PslH